MALFRYGRGRPDNRVPGGCHDNSRRPDHLLTNFHLPASTLLMLVCAFAGYEKVMAAYRHAVSAGYRFYSYGDAMLLTHQVRPC